MIFFGGTSRGAPNFCDIFVRGFFVGGLKKMERLMWNDALKLANLVSQDFFSGACGRNKRKNKKTRLVGGFNPSEKY